MAYATMDYFVFGEQVTAARINQFIDNDEALRDGSGLSLAAGTVPTTALSTGAWDIGTPAATGFSAKTKDILHYKKLGRICVCFVYIDGTSNATTLTFTVPHTSATYDVQRFGGFLTANNSAAGTNPGRVDIASNSTTATAYLGHAANAWTASGSKYIIGGFTYETAS